MKYLTNTSKTARRPILLGSVATDAKRYDRVIRKNEGLNTIVAFQRLQQLAAFVK